MKTYLRCFILMLITVKMPTIVGILTFMSMINSMLSWIEHKKFYYPGAWSFTQKTGALIYYDDYICILNLQSLIATKLHLLYRLLVYLKTVCMSKFVLGVSIYM